MPDRRDIPRQADAGPIETLRHLIDRYLSDLAESKSPTSLYEPVAAVLESRGKRLRPLLTILTAEAYGVPASISMPGAAAVEVFHNFTLVHDDIMDQSDTRRGQPTVHVVWGMPAGILAGDFMLGLAYELLTRLPDESVKPALECFSAMVVRLCEGQALDAEFEASNEVTVPEYLDMVSRKTGALLVASLKIGGIIGGASAVHLEALERVGYHLGLAFQIQDDLLDLTADAADWGKPVGADFIAGKRAFLLLQAVEAESGSDSRWFRTLMEQGGVDKSRISEVKDRIQHLGVLETTRSVILREYRNALEALDSLERHVSLHGLRRIIEQMQTRIR